MRWRTWTRASQAGSRPGDIIVGGRNWGCGSSREQAVTCLRAAGVRVIIAASFARIFFRNAVNNGLLPIVCPEAVAAIQPGEPVTVDVDRCVVRCAAGEFALPPLSPSVTAILEAGGLLPMLKQPSAFGRGRSTRCSQPETQNDDHLPDSRRRRRPGGDARGRAKPLPPPCPASASSPRRPAGIASCAAAPRCPTTPCARSRAADATLFGATQSPHPAREAPATR